MKGNSKTDLPIIETGVVLEWSDGTESEVVSIYFDEDGVPQIRLKEYHAGGSEPFRTISVTYEDIRGRINKHGDEIVDHWVPLDSDSM